MTRDPCLLRLLEWDTSNSTREPLESEVFLPTRTKGLPYTVIYMGKLKIKGCDVALECLLIDITLIRSLSNGIVIHIVTASLSNHVKNNQNQK